MKSKLYIIFLFQIIVLFPAGNTIAQSFNWNWLKSWGGLEKEILQDIGVDDSGNVFTTGTFYSSLIDVDPGVTTYYLNQSMMAVGQFITKLDKYGNFVWARQFTAPKQGSFSTISLTVSRNGNIYLGGIFKGMPDFDPGPGTYFMSSAPTDGDIFILKLDGSGNFVWAKKIRNGISSYGATVKDMAVDEYENIYTIGGYGGVVDFDPGPGVQSFTAPLGGGYTLKLDSSGNFIWVNSYHQAYLKSIALDSSANVNITGAYSNSIDLDPGAGLLLLISNGLFDFLISQVDSAGNFIWGKSIGGTGDDVSTCLATDNAENIFVTGYFHGYADFNPDSLIIDSLVTKGADDAFITKYDNAGNYQWTRKIGGPYNDRGYGITADHGGMIFITGEFNQWADFKTGPDSLILDVGSLRNALFTAAMDNSGNIRHAEYGAEIYDNINGAELRFPITHDGGIIYTGGSYKSPALSFGPFYVTNNSTNNIRDVFLAKITCTTYSSLNIKACNSYTSPSGKYTWTVSGSYLDTISSVSGCDSFLTIYLTIGTVSSSSTINLINCGPFVSPSSLYTWTVDGTYMDTIPNATGCDSVMTINLTILQNSAFTYIDTVCHAYHSPSGKYTWYSAGVYNDTIQNSVGCDSVLVIQLVSKNTFSFVALSGCRDKVSPSGLYLWSVPGTYHDTITNVWGCDSIMTINLSLTLLDTSVTLNGTNLFSNLFGAVYQWLYCDSGLAPVPGATNQVFNPAHAGSFAVVVSKNGCTDTSDCYTVIGVGINELTQQIFEIGPNPASDEVTVLSNMQLSADATNIRDITGKLMPVNAIVGDHYLKIDVKDLASGIYFLEIHTKDFTRTEKLVISR